MWSPSSSFRHVLVIFLVHIMLVEFPYLAETRNLASRSLANSSIPALFIFGDSTVDSGNNNYIKTIARSNFPPYGKDFPNHIPTGRFTNGKLLTDFLVSYAGIKDFMPPYLDPTLSLDDLKTGVCFASAGTGFDPLTAQIRDGVISMENQLKYFKEYKSRMELHIGKESTRILISKALFYISAGTNDFILNYYGPPIRRKTYTISAYQDFVLQLSQEFVQGLLNAGVRNIGFVGLPPIGCLPAIITLNSGDPVSRCGCIEWMSAVARNYNRLLQNILRAMQNQGVNIKYIDVYNPVDDMIKNPQQFATAARDFPVSAADDQSIPISTTTVLIFGDSTADPGNNNYIETAFKSNFSPYGQDFVNQTATGRFTNGRLPSDFLAKYAGVKEYVPPYLDPTLSIEELKSGVSFASAGSGFDPLTPTITNVISLSDQLEHFRNGYRAKMEAAIGKDKTKELINNALFFVSAGTNDFVVNYFTLPIRRRNYTIPDYMNFVLQETRQLLQGLLDEGARRIGVAGLPPMGCLPIVITLYANNPILERDCISNFSSIARDYNHKLQNELNDMQLQLQPSGSRIAYMDVFGPLEDMTLGRKYDFEEVSSGCCGTGLLEASFLCNSECHVCEDSSKYVFWDSIHPTEKSYYIISQAIRPVIDTLVKS